HLRRVRWFGLPAVQAHRVDRGSGLRHGASQCAGRLRRGCREVHSLCLRHGHRPPGHAALWRERPAAVLRKRLEVPPAVSRRVGGKLPLSWLAEWVDIPWDAAELARRLTAGGFEVEGLEPAAPAFTGVVVAEIMAIAPHPDAEKLRVC